MVFSLSKFPNDLRNFMGKLKIYYNNNLYDIHLQFGVLPNYALDYESENVSVHSKQE